MIPTSILAIYFLTRVEMCAEWIIFAYFVSLSLYSNWNALKWGDFFVIRSTMMMMMANAKLNPHHAYHFDQMSWGLYFAILRYAITTTERCSNWTDGWIVYLYINKAVTILTILPRITSRLPPIWNVTDTPAFTWKNTMNSCGCGPCECVGQ